MPFLEDLEQPDIDKDTSKSCVFGWPDRPLDTLPPEYPPVDPPTCYPYCAFDDWPTPPPPIIPFPDPPPDNDPPIFDSLQSTHIFVFNLADLLQNLSTRLEMTFPEITFCRQTGKVGYVRSGVVLSSKIIPPLDVNNRSVLRFWHQSPTQIGIETYIFLLKVNYVGSQAIPPNGNNGIAYFRLQGNAFWNGEIHVATSFDIDVPVIPPYNQIPQFTRPPDSIYNPYDPASPADFFAIDNTTHSIADDYGELDSSF